LDIKAVKPFGFLAKPIPAVIYMMAIFSFQNKIFKLRRLKTVHIYYSTWLNLNMKGKPLGEPGLNLREQTYRGHLEGYCKT